jgi:hypothetical protein
MNPATENSGTLVKVEVAIDELGTRTLTSTYEHVDADNEVTAFTYVLNSESDTSEHDPLVVALFNTTFTIGENDATSN